MLPRPLRLPDRNLQPLYLTSEGDLVGTSEGTGNLTELKACEVHMEIACSDARFHSKHESEAWNIVKKRSAEKGIYLIRHTEGVAGTMATPDVIVSAKRTLHNTLMDLFPVAEVNTPITVFFHVITHGKLEEQTAPNLQIGKRIKYTPHAYKMVECNYTCGMCHAQEIMTRFERLLIEEQPFLPIPSLKDPDRPEPFQITNENSIKELMHRIYGYDGLMSDEGFTPSIRDLAGHANRQKNLIKEAMCIPELFKVQMRFTSANLDFGNGKLSRVDGNEDTIGNAIDQFYGEVARLMKKDPEPARAEPQDVKLVLIHHADVENALETADYAHFGAPLDPSRVFKIGGSLADSFYLPLGRFKLASLFHFAPKAKKLALLGVDEKQTARMHARIMTDPLVRFVLEYFDVEIYQYSSPGLTREQLAMIAQAKDAPAA